MIRNYLRSAFRIITRYPAHSVLNISGLAIGMAAAILILLWVQDEWSCDRHYKNADNIFRLLQKETLPGGEVTMLAPTPSALTKALKDEYPEIIRATRLAPFFITLNKGEEFISEGIFGVEKDFFEMFDIEFIRGNVSSSFNDPASIIITEEMSAKYFGEDDPLGKTYSLSQSEIVLTVTGVVRELPQNSHIRFDFLVPAEFMKVLGATPDEWNMLDHNFIELAEGTDIKRTNEKIRDLLKNHMEGSSSELFLQNIKRIHLYSSKKFTYDFSGLGDITYVRMMCLIAFFILVIACINFMNLSTAQYVQRAKEIGMRKITGSGRWKIITRFLGESLLIVFVAQLTAMILVELFLTGFNNLTGKDLEVGYNKPGLYLGLIVIMVFCSLTAGSYPAFYLSSLKPLDIMRGLISRNPGKTPLRRVLVIFQFSLSVILIICTIIIGNQLYFIQNKKLGFNKESIGYFQFPAAPWDPKVEAVKKELLNNPDILSVTRVFFNYENPLNIEDPQGGFKWEGKDVGNDALFYIRSADEDYAKTFQLELKTGRYFSSEFTNDKNAVVINETAAEIMGLNDPVGKIITSPGGTSLNIIGVVKDFHFRSLHYKIEPLIMQLGASNTLFIKMTPRNTDSILESVNKIYTTFNPGSPLDFHFLDNDFNNLYRTEQRISKIFKYFSALAIIIACLGLFGLSSYITLSRTKEIGIRKTNGSRSSEIFIMLSKEFFNLMVISFVIACPVAVFAIQGWLDDFAYRVIIEPRVFGLTALIVTFVTILTVGFQSYKAAAKNPVEALRYE